MGDEGLKAPEPKGKARRGRKPKDPNAPKKAKDPNAPGRAKPSAWSRHRVFDPEIPFPRLSLESPNDFRAVHTKFGWFLVPKKYTTQRWTREEVEKYIQEHAKDTSACVAELQPLVEQWVKSADLSTKPKSKRMTADEIEQYHNDMLYRSHIRDDPKLAANEPKKRVKAKTNGVTFIHAWNYYLSLTLPKYTPELGYKSARALASQQWRDMSTIEKEKHRAEYEQLLSEGKDIYHGLVVGEDEKELLKRNPGKWRKILWRKPTMEEYQKMKREGTWEAYEQDILQEEAARTAGETAQAAAEKAVSRAATAAKEAEAQKTSKPREVDEAEAKTTES